MVRNVTKIPAWVNPQTAVPINAQVKRKVAGYARVSTDHDEQQTSYEAQLDYYTNLIQGNENWEFAGMYSDEGVTGTSTKKREGFQSMVADALAGKIDLIVTKSVSRFARNTVDSLSTIRLLKEHGTEVYFEKENIWTFDSKGELLITIMSSLAQEESRSISENVTWGHRKRMADGKVSLAYRYFLGYDKRKTRCATPHLSENEVRAAFLRVVNKLIADKAMILKELREDQALLTGVGELEKEQKQLATQMNIDSDAVQEAIAQNAGKEQDQDEYGTRYEALSARFRETKARYDAVTAEIAQRGIRRREFGRFIRSVEALPEMLTEFSEELWGALVDHLTVYSKDNIVFTLTSGMEMKA